MNKKGFNIICITLLLSLFISCKKENDVVNYVFEDLNIDAKFHKMTFINDSVAYVCGGNKKESGVIYKTIDGGKNWNNIYTNNINCINDIFFINDSVGYACGDNLMQIKTTDGGQSWNKLYNHSFSDWLDYLTPLQCLYFTNKDTGFAVGGDKYMAGVICKTYNGGVDWIFSSFDNEYKSVFFPNDSVGYIAGYGIIQKTSDAGKNLTILDMGDDYFTSLYFINSDIGFAAGYNGGIYKTTDAGNSWNTVLKPNSMLKKRINLNYIYFTNSTTGYAVGNNGVYLTTNDGGDSWKQYIIDETLNMFSITANSHGKIFICCDKGKIIKL